jgi:hypothetical protein
MEIDMADEEVVITLRAHHLLCMQGFQGYGYNKDFVDNMYFINSMIDSTPDLLIEIVAVCDDICDKCPNLNENKCSRNPDADKTVRGMDKIVLEKLGLEPGAKLKVEDIIDLVSEHFKQLIDIKDICGDCEWQKECLYYLAKKHNM